MKLTGKVEGRSYDEMLLGAADRARNMFGDGPCRITTGLVEIEDLNEIPPRFVATYESIAEPHRDFGKCGRCGRQV